MFVSSFGFNINRGFVLSIQDIQWPYRAYLIGLCITEVQRRSGQPESRFIGGKFSSRRCLLSFSTDGFLKAVEHRPNCLTSLVLHIGTNQKVMRPIAFQNIQHV